MDSDKPPPPPHRTTSTSSTSDLFICFTARHHSSMKISSKSSLSPGRAGTSRDPPISLSTSLSRRLRTSRSIKGGASPAMFPTTTGKKRTGGFENPEPSSPKVTCIGQVRVKSKKKHGKRLRTLSRRHSTGDVSFRKLDHSRDGFSRSQKLGPNYHQGGGSNSFGSSNQDNLPEQRNNPNPRWVHLPLTICEALRAFGSEFSCLFPCRSSCFSPATEREKEEKTAAGGDRQSSGSCAAVFTRWLVAFQDGNDGGRGGGREIELVVGDDDDDEDEEIRTSRRHVFDDLEIVNDRIEGSKDEGRMSICIPPKNALLLMRCRSDPLKMEALANRLWEPTIGDYEEEDDEDENFIEYEDQIPLKEVDSNESKAFHQETNEENQETNEEDLEKEEESTFFGSLFEEIVDQDLENVEMEEELFEEEEIPETEMESNFEKVKGFEEEMVVTQFGDRSEEMVRESKESKEREAVGVLEREGLPECLLLMMCEPKLSMEVSKETWVSSKDFIRRHSSRKKPPPPQPPLPPSLLVKPPTGQDESKVSAATTTTTTITTTLARATRFHNHVTAEDAASAVALIQPGRSSCSLPAPPSMAEMLEQKLVNAVGYEPFVLTRCKSEPMRTAAAKLAPDSCFWKNRKLEPLRRASFGVGAAGVGF
ncbi:hypothetical protein L6452_28568 [Arctium lappa]|uniref:Uncharacterized protein n=1 Tax=Arctium lappa TaxID=4217 RepID=A0ACB8ZYL4_ARCLA|nr:hypothetical protein L6452_28568 [Arctium lappa]